MSNQYGGGADMHNSYQLDYDRANSRMISTSPGRRQIMYTSDGVNWSRTPERTNNNSPWYAFLVGSEEYFLWGRNGYIYTSNDLTRDLNDWEEWDKPSSSLINQDGTFWFETPLGFVMVGKYSASNPTARALYSSTGKQGWKSYSVGDRVISAQTTVIPGLSASAVSPTSSAPTASAGTISSWDYAEWQIATDAAFTQNVQTSTASLSSSGTQSGPSFSYNNGTVYYIITRYVAADPVGPVSDWSSPIHFQTAP